MRPNQARDGASPSQPLLKTFISDNAADPEKYPLWIERGSRLGDAVLALSSLFSRLRGGTSNGKHPFGVARFRRQGSFRV